MFPTAIEIQSSLADALPAALKHNAVFFFPDAFIMRMDDSNIAMRIALRDERWSDKPRTGSSLRHLSSPPRCQQQLTIDWRCRPSRRTHCRLAEHQWTECPEEAEKDGKRINSSKV